MDDDDANAEGDWSDDVSADADAEADADGEADAGEDGGGDAGPGAPVRSFNAAGGLSTNSEYRLEGALGGPPGPGVSSNSEYRLESGSVRLIRGR